MILKRRDFIEKMKQLDPSCLIYIDEAGSTVAMTRARARSPKGARAFGAVPRCRGTVTTIIGALTIHGLSEVMTIEGGTTGAVFKTFIEHTLLKRLGPNNVIVMDNLGAHHAKEVTAVIEGTGAKILFLPPYSPELNPIEEAWSKVKEYIRSREPRTIERLDAVIAEAAERVTPDDARGWIEHAGYHLKR